MAKEIKKSEILSMLQEGKTRIEIAKYFGTSPANLAKGMKQLGIDDVRAKRVTFVDDIVEQNTNTVDNSEYDLEKEMEKLTSVPSETTESNTTDNINSSGIDSYNSSNILNND